MFNFRSAVNKVSDAAKAAKNQAADSVAQARTHVEQSSVGRGVAEAGRAARSSVEQSEFSSSVGRVAEAARAKAEQGIGKVRSLGAHGESRRTTWSAEDWAAPTEPLPPLDVRVCSWNLHGSLIAPEDDVKSWLLPSTVSVAQLYVVGVQELVELGAKTTVLNASGDDARQQALESRVEDTLTSTGHRFLKVCGFGMVGLALIIYIREDVAPYLRSLDCDRVKTGMDGQFGNKGSVCARFVMGDVSFCFANVHLASGLHNTYERTQHLVDVLANAFQATQAFKGTSRPAKLGFKRQSRYKIESHHFSVVFGDFNSRLQMPQEEKECHPEGPPDAWLEKDQLLLGYYPCLSDAFHEGVVAFPPTYKYIPGTNQLTDKRCPAWTDRIFYRVTRQTDVAIHEYDSFANLICTSDHRPIAAQFRVMQDKASSSAESVAEARIEEARGLLADLPTGADQAEFVCKRLLAIDDHLSTTAQGLDDLTLVGAQRERRRELLSQIETLGKDVESRKSDASPAQPSSATPALGTNATDSTTESTPKSAFDLASSSAPESASLPDAASALSEMQFSPPARTDVASPISHTAALPIGLPSGSNSTDAEIAARESAENETAEKAAREAAEKEAAEKVASEAAEKEASERVAREPEKEAAEKAASAAVEKMAAEKAAREAAEKEAAEIAAREAEKEAAEKATTATAEKEAAEKATREAAEKKAAEEAARRAAENEAAEIAAREATEKEAAENAAREAAEKEAAHG